MTALARVAICFLLFSMLGADCDEHPNLDAGFELLDVVAPNAYRMVEETSDRSVAIRRYLVPGDEARPENLLIPAAYERKEELTVFDSFDEMSGVRTLAVWSGPSLSGNSKCSLHFAVVRDGAEGIRTNDMKLIELSAGCALAAD